MENKNSNLKMSNDYPKHTLYGNSAGKKVSRVGPKQVSLEVILASCNPIKHEMAGCLLTRDIVSAVWRHAENIWKRYIQGN